MVLPAVLRIPDSLGSRSPNGDTQRRSLQSLPGKISGPYRRGRGKGGAQIIQRLTGTAFDYPQRVLRIVARRERANTSERVERDVRCLLTPAQQRRCMTGNRLSQTLLTLRRTQTLA